MPFQVPASRASVKQNVFEFVLPGSKKVWSLPKIQFTNADVMTRMNVLAPRIANPDTGESLENPDPADVAEAQQIQRELIEAYCPGLYALVDMEQLEALIVAWRDASTISLGESSASSPS